MKRIMLWMLATILLLSGLTTLTSTGVIDAINAALQASMGNTSDAKKAYEDGTCDIVVNGRLAGLAASKRATSVIAP